MRKFFASGEMAEFVKKYCVAVATNGGNTITFVTASGTVVARPATNGDGKNDRDVDSRSLLAKFNKLSEAELKPKKLGPSAFFDRLMSHSITAPVPLRTLVCRQYYREFERDAKGELRHYENRLTFAGPNGNFLWLTEAEWKSLVPANPTKGMKHPVPAAIAQRIFTQHLTLSTMAVGNGQAAWLAKHVRSGELTLTVEDASAAAVRLHLKGFARMSDVADFAKGNWHAELSLLGVLNYDAKKKVFDRFDVAALGDYRNGRPGNGPNGQKGVLGIAFELAAADSLGYGVPPARLGQQGMPNCAT